MNEAAFFRLINAQVRVVNGFSSGVCHKFSWGLKVGAEAPWD
jgi:hypothetical protein